MPRTAAVPESKSLDDLEHDYEILCEELKDVRATHRDLRLKRRELYCSKTTTPADLDDVGAALRDLEARIEGLESAVEDLSPEVVAARALRDRRNSVAGEIAQAEVEVTSCELVMQLADKMGEIRGIFEQIGAVRGHRPVDVYYDPTYGSFSVRALQRQAFHKWHPRNSYLVDELTGNLARARRDLANLRAEAARLDVAVPAGR